MRLLHTHSLELQKFMPNAMPECAILPHTWDDEEATLQDIVSKDFQTNFLTVVSGKMKLTSLSQEHTRSSTLLNYRDLQGDSIASD